MVVLLVDFRRVCKKWETLSVLEMGGEDEWVVEVWEVVLGVVMGEVLGEVMVVVFGVVMGVALWVMMVVVVVLGRS